MHVLKLIRQLSDRRDQVKAVQSLVIRLSLKVKSYTFSQEFQALKFLGI
jgi:hypothetical protein